jgi:hypothetical protein
MSGTPETPNPDLEAETKDRLARLIADFQKTVTDPMKNAGIVNAFAVSLFDPENNAKGEFKLFTPDTNPMLDMQIHLWDPEEETYTSAESYIITPEFITFVLGSMHEYNSISSLPPEGFTNTVSQATSQAERRLAGFLAPIKKAQAENSASLAVPDVQLSFHL